MYKEVIGDLIALAKEGKFDVITHGCNCFCTMGAGIAPQMAKAFGADKYRLEAPIHKGKINKLGQIDGEFVQLKDSVLHIINSYTQYHYGSNHKDGVKNPVDYLAIAMCLRKINHEFKGMKIGLPKIGCGLAGGDWNYVRNLIQTELSSMDVTVVIYNK